MYDGVWYNIHIRSSIVVAKLSLKPHETFRMTVAHGHIREKIFIFWFWLAFDAEHCLEFDMQHTPHTAHLSMTPTTTIIIVFFLRAPRLFHCAYAMFGYYALLFLVVLSFTFVSVIFHIFHLFQLRFCKICGYILQANQLFKTNFLFCILCPCVT